MALVITPTYITVDQGAQVMTGTVTLTGNYGTASSNGEVFNITTLAYQGLPLQISPGTTPFVEFFETPLAGAVPTGYNPGYAYGATPATAQFTLMNGLTQYTPGSAYSAVLLATTFSFVIICPTL